MQLLKTILSKDVSSKLKKSVFLNDVILGFKLSAVDRLKSAISLKIAKESTRALNFDSGPGEIPAEEKVPKEEEKAPKEEKKAPKEDSFPEEYANQCFEKVKEEEIEEDNEPIYYEDERLQKCF